MTTPNSEPAEPTAAELQATVAKLETEVRSCRELVSMVSGLVGDIWFGNAPEPDVKAVFDLHGNRWARRVHIDSIWIEGALGTAGHYKKTERYLWSPQRFRLGSWRDPIVQRAETWVAGPMAHGPVSTVPPVKRLR